MPVRPYEPQDEQGWVRCRVLSFLDTAYFDDVVRKKPRYERPSVELVAEIDGAIVGIIDVELDTEPNEVASNPKRRGGVIWTVAVHPDHQRKGVGRALLTAAIDGSRARGAEFLEAWTRDDMWVRGWYETAGFVIADRYMHVYLDAYEAAGAVNAPQSLHIESVFVHYRGAAGAMPVSAIRTHECVRFVLGLEGTTRSAKDAGTAKPSIRQLIRDATFPESSGVYVVYDPDTSVERPLYVGVAAAQTLRKRWRSNHLSKRAGSSALRRTLGVELGLVETKLTHGVGRFYPPEVEAAITHYLETCQIEFYETATADEADSLELELSRLLKPTLNISTARRRRTQRPAPSRSS